MSEIMTYHVQNQDQKHDQNLEIDCKDHEKSCQKGAKSRQFSGNFMKILCFSSQIWEISDKYRVFCSRNQDRSCPDHERDHERDHVRDPAPIMNPASEKGVALRPTSCGKAVGPGGEK